MFFRDNRPFIDSFNVDVVAHCNLNCKYCDHFAPLAEEEFVDLTQMKFIPPKTSQEDLIKLFDEKKAKIEEKFRTAFS